MCGIYGYVGEENAYMKTIEGLKLLQYRGYDSCGIAYYRKGFKINKAVGTLNNLKTCKTKPNIAFGHTRWATNGVVSETNAHPHVSYNKEYTVVHNGIIHNAHKLKSELISKGITFYSQTDTEVICNYLTTINIETELNNIFRDLDGTFSLIIGKKDSELYLVKKFSPLHILLTENAIYISSDVSSLPTGKLYTLNDNEIIKIKNNEVINYNNKPIVYKTHTNVLKQMQLEDHNHFMIKEILETPKAIKSAYESIKAIDFNSLLKNYNKVTLLGCGTAYNSCLIGEQYFKELNIDSDCYLASNYILRKKINKKHLHLIVSQSGETADCIKVAEQIKKMNGHIFLITNEPSSTLARMVDFVILTNAQKELAVASTKTYSCQVFIFAYIFNILKNKNYVLDINKLERNLNKFINLIDMVPIAKRLKDLKHLILVGKNMDYLTLVEASLKIKEINYIYTLPMFASELKHGTLSLVERGTVVLTFNTGDDNVISSTINEIESREGEVIEMNKYFPKIESEKAYNPIYAVIPFQLLSYHMAIMNGTNPDMPRNLAKSVTVE